MDNIPNEIFKKESLQEPLLQLYNMCFIKRCTPTYWQCAIINPIPKRSTKDPHVPLNYRGLGLLLMILKLFTSLINAHLNNYVEVNELLEWEQAGFRKGYSCQDQTYILSSIKEK